MPNINHTKNIAGTISVSYFVMFTEELKLNKNYSCENGTLWAKVFKNFTARKLKKGVILVSFICDAYVKYLFDKYVTLCEIQPKIPQLRAELNFIDPNERDSIHYVNLEAILTELETKERQLLN